MSEALYGAEFYRCAYNILKGEIYRAPEFGIAARQSDRAWIDFFVPAYNWGCEWLRDGSEIAAHYRRFEGNGRYKRWLDSGNMTDYLHKAVVLE